ncbi:MAG: septal ring lytic transglycosylase RlpA family protein, partial [Gammaproteobacteria bacterium]|nr:septal ring lytic transglycosylase RlpA family protein [Gammaproteobacteria bacterium]
MSFGIIFTAILPLLACTPLSQINRNISTIDGPPLSTINLGEIADAEPRYEPLSRYGNPESYTVLGKKYIPQQERAHHKEEGLASWYGRKFHGRLTSNREPYDMLAMTAAHKTLPLPSYVTVTNLLNRKKIIVRVNDRGPFAENRIIDLSYAAATKLDLVDRGVAPVIIETILPRPLSTENTHRQENIYLQAGSFSERHRAITLSNKLNHLFPTQVIEAHQQDKIFYRVRSGPFT